jgi:hypothetical protein
MRRQYFMKRSRSEYIIHGLFVDDMMPIYCCDAIKDEFMQLYSKDFEITGARQMKTFLGMQVKQAARSIKKIAAGSVLRISGIGQHFTTSWNTWPAPL